MIANAQWEIDRNGYISPYEVGLADWVDTKFNAHRSGVASQRILKQWHNGASFLGEWRIFKYFTDLQEEFVWSGWKTEETGDKWDFKWRGLTVDVKNRSTSFISNLLEYEVILDDPEQGAGNQIQKPMDIYIFTLWNPKEQNVYILGWQTKEGFIFGESCRRVEKGEEIWLNYNANQPIYLLKVRDLNPIATLSSIDPIFAT